MSPEGVLSKLRKYAVWSEAYHRDGFIRLIAVRPSSGLVGYDFPEKLLLELVRSGLVKVSTQTRIVLNDNYLKPRPVEIIQRYWTVAS